MLSFSGMLNQDCILSECNIYNVVILFKFTLLKPPFSVVPHSENKRFMLCQFLRAPCKLLAKKKKGFQRIFPMQDYPLTYHALSKKCGVKVPAL